MQTLSFIICVASFLIKSGYRAIYKPGFFKLSKTTINNNAPNFITSGQELFFPNCRLFKNFYLTNLFSNLWDNQNYWLFTWTKHFAKH